jgi:hypothetical protein
VPTNDVIESIDEYCKRLSKTLHKVPAQERDDLVREVRSHVLERVEAEPRITPEILAEILRAVGEPKELAAEYLTQTMLREATRGEALWVLRPSLRDRNLRNFRATPSFLRARHTGIDGWTCSRAPREVAHPRRHCMRRVVLRRDFNRRTMAHRQISPEEEMDCITRLCELHNTRWKSLGDRCTYVFGQGAMAICAPSKRQTASNDDLYGDKRGACVAASTSALASHEERTRLANYKTA